MKYQFLGLIACLAAASSGCKPNVAAINVVAIDRSGSTAAMRLDQEGGVVSLFGATQDRGRQLAVWAVDRKSVCLYGPLIPDCDRLPPEVYQELQPRPRSSATITRPALFWEEMAREYGSVDKQIRIAYFTDGGNDVADDLPRVRKAAEKLALNKNIWVAIIGLQPDERTWIRRDFQLFGSRLATAGPGEEAQAALDAWLARADRQ